MNPLLLTDGYKTGHHLQYPKGTTLVYSNFTPRSNKYAPEGCEVVSFGQQMIMKQIHEAFDRDFFSRPKDEVCGEMKTELSMYLNTDYDVSHFEALHDLGYLPIKVKSLPEGNVVPIKVPVLTIVNTHPDFYWVTNYLETIISNLLWKPMTSASISRHYRKVLTKWQEKTATEQAWFIDWQGHDFSMRGMDSVEATISSGLGHLVGFSGSDSLPAIYGARKFYNEDGFVAGSVNATEHSVMCAGSKDDEEGTFRRLMETYPGGILSVVSDTWDLWKVITEYLPAMKEEILSRDGKLVIRPDSGDPVDILCGTNANIHVVHDEGTSYDEDGCSDEGGLSWKEWAAEYAEEKLIEQTPHGEYGGDINVRVQFKGEVYNVHYKPEWNRHDKQYYFIDSYGSGVDYCTFTKVESTPEQFGVIELLWNIFGGTVNAQGYKELDPHIGAIYGDSITIERANEICKRLEAKGFASTNVVLGIGSFTYQFNTRDTFGFAMKATYVEVNGEGQEIFKDPITDDGTKKSATGLLYVGETEEGYFLVDKVGKDGESHTQHNGVMIDEGNGCLEVIYENGTFHRQTTLTEVRKRVIDGLKTLATV